MEEDKYHEYLDSCINIGEIEKEESMDTLKIEFSPITENVENYYKLEKDGEWKKYNDIIDITNLFDINNVDINMDKIDLNIYAKQVDKAGNTLINSKIQDIKKIRYKLDVFNDVKLSGKTLEEYGFTATFVNREDYAFAVGNFQAGHHYWSRTYSGTFKLSNIKYKPNKIGINVFHHYDSGGSVQTRLRVVYKDGDVSANTVGSYGNKSLTVDVKDKEIDYIEIYISGYDPDGGSSYGRATSIVFYGIEIPINN